MKKFLFLGIVLTAAILVFIQDNSLAMKARTFDLYEKNLDLNKELKLIGEVTLKPGEEKSFSTYSYKPLTIDFKTAVSKEEFSKIKGAGIGIKKLSNLKYYLKDPIGASMDVLPENGVVNVSVKNFEKFPITVKVYKKDFQRT